MCLFQNALSLSKITSTSATIQQPSFIITQPIPIMESTLQEELVSPPQLQQQPQTSFVKTQRIFQSKANIIIISPVLSISNIWDVFVSKCSFSLENYFRLSNNEAIKVYPTNSNNGINLAGGTGFSITTSTTASNQFCENTAHFPIKTKYH